MEGQTILDMGTGSGVIPRRLSGNGCTLWGIDISPEQISEAQELAAAEKAGINWKIVSAEDTGLKADFFDAVTAVQCWFYFDVEKAVNEVLRVLKPRGKLLIGFMNWLPFEDEIASQT